MGIENLIGMTVEHKSFGTGMVKEVYDKYLEVEFLKNNRSCKFVYPACFYRFLQQSDKEVKKYTESLDVAKVITCERTGKS